MKKQSIVLVLVLALSISMFAGTYKANAVAVTHPSSLPNIISWVNYPAYQNMSAFPQFLAAYVHYGNKVYTPTTLVIDGLDVNLKSIEASATIPVNANLQTPYIFNDTHTTPPTPVAFSTITRIYQINGTDNEEFDIHTIPEALYIPGASTTTPQGLEQYLGQYETPIGYQPGQYGTDGVKYEVTVGVGIPYAVQTYPFEPLHPEPIKVVVNYVDGVYPSSIQDRTFHNGQTTTGAASGTTLTIYGMDQWGNPLVVAVGILAGAQVVYVTGDWSTICNVTGGAGDSYYLFTEPLPQQTLFTYTLLINHISIAPDSYDILANPSVPQGSTPVTVVLRDIDDNPIYAAAYGTINNPSWIIVNFHTEAGTIRFSTDLTIQQGMATATANLAADTNPRTINVTAVAWVPPCTTNAHGAFTLFAWTELTEDGVNTANDFTWGMWPIHTMLWGYTDSASATYVLNVPPKPYAPSWLGGPNATNIKLDGPIEEVTIPLYVGCNLISSPVSPLLNGGYYTNYPTSVDISPGPTTTYNTVYNNGIPMDLLFSKTAAPDVIEAIWWYTPDGSSSGIVSAPGTWHVYVPGISADPTAYFRDGIGYWVKADQNCTIEISGVSLENGPFTPPVYPLRGESWNLIGVSTQTSIATTDYLESTMGSTCFEAAGPVWTYTNPMMANLPPFLGGWFRDPSTLYPTQAIWVYNKVPGTIGVAP